MPSIPLPSKWIPWACWIAFALAFFLALACPQPHPVDPSQLTHAHDTTTQRIAVKDSVQSRVKTAHARASLQVKRLAPLRARVVVTPNAVLVDGADTLSGPGVGVVAQVITQQDTVIARLKDESAVKDTAIVAGDSALAASLRETAVAKSLIPSRTQRVTTAIKWGVIGGVLALALHALVTR